MSEGRRRLTHEQRREQLLTAAVQLAAGRDLAALSVQDIAEHAGVSDGLLYHYFPTKQALLTAVLQRAADTMTVALDTAAKGPPLEQLTADLAAYLDHVQAEPAGWRVLLGARTGDLAAMAAAVEDHSRMLVLAGLGISDPSPALALALNGWAAFERDVCLSWLDHPEMTRTSVEDVLTSTFFAALQAAARHDRQTREVLARLAIST